MGIKARINIKPEHLRTGDTLVCSADRLVSKAIKGFTKSKISHTANVVCSHGRVLIVEAQKKGVHIITYEQWVKRYGYTYIVARPTRIDRCEYAKMAFSKQALKNYDIKAILIDFPIYILSGKWIGEKTAMDVLLDNKYNCSTLTGLLHDLEDWWKLTPEDIFVEMVIDRKGKFKVL